MSICKKILINLKSEQPLTPSDLSKINITVDCPSVVAITGRGPIWLYSFLTHVLHIAVALYVFDPRLGYVCVASHNPNFAVGDILADFTPDQTIDITS